ncbi:hypothetical protein [Streptomyces sp. NBC_00239]|uniref:hypothetical protein n=1 Tax=Streptomyces sp. NBC_00239 TaxID=2903640 RepID=UPI002E282AC5|nr:hypothetical protein [Streptomyces sp. NBC_00239]
MTWGSLSGVGDKALDRLLRLAAPQPAGTLTEPPRLTGAATDVPSSAVFCTDNGLSTALVEGLVAAGEPSARALTDPRTCYFDLPTGHWPMLSAPEALTAVLLRAAAGEGHRLTAPATP